MSETTQKETPRYNGIPKQVSRKDFNRYILPHLSKRIKGPKPKLSFYWSKDGSYEKLFEASVIHLLDTEELDTSRLHGDGANMVVKKGAMAPAIQDTNTRRVKRN